MLSRQLSCNVEKASIDEAFLDFTHPVREIMLQRYPELSKVPEDMNTPLPPPPRIKWDGLGNVIPVYPPQESADDTGSDAGDEEHELQPEEPPTTWHDVALSIAAELMDSIRKKVDAELGYTTSAVRTTIRIWKIPC
jgi:DNA polymerase eta